MASAGRPLPTTFECIEAIALREPKRLALVQHMETWTYEALYADMTRTMRVLAELGVKRGDRVAVGTEGFQASMVLLVALEHMGAVTASFLHKNDADAQKLFGMVDWVFSDSPQATPQKTRFLLVDGHFVLRIEVVNLADARPLPAAPLTPDEPQRIARTSGSSGQSKFMLLPRQAQDYWIQDVASSCRLDANSRLLVTGPLVANGTFARASACLRIGAAVFDCPRMRSVLPEVTHIAAMPVQLESLLSGLPADYKPPRAIDVCTVGSFVAPSLRAAAVQRFGGQVSSRYGINETGGICDDIDANGVGILKAGVDLRIVGVDGHDVPRGQAGIIAVRTPGMVDGYIDEADATHEAFCDGWFFTGDWGALVAPRVLRLMGRRDDLVNAGGIKLPAATIEMQVRNLVQPRDCAVLSVNLDGGQTSLGIALVVGADAQRDALRQRIAEGLQLGATIGAKVIFLPMLPCLRSGKIDRVALLKLFEAPPPGSI
jgi:acyl-coenzyme A synthetase/AMP-(fatty) acid ligase